MQFFFFGTAGLEPNRVLFRNALDVQFEPAQIGSDFLRFAMISSEPEECAADPTVAYRVLNPFQVAPRSRVMVVCACERGPASA
jgi:hypothetical protein